MIQPSIEDEVLVAKFIQAVQADFSNQIIIMDARNNNRGIPVDVAVDIGPSRDKLESLREEILEKMTRERQQNG